MQFDCGTRILRVISRPGRPCHLSKLHQYLRLMRGPNDLSVTQCPDRLVRAIDWAKADK